ncbi:MAG: signal peptidase II [Planctomycetaceae bacterium]
MANDESVATGTATPRDRPMLAADRWRLAARIVFWCIALDQTTKVLATRLLPTVPLSFLGDTFRLQHALNTGAFLGMAGSWSPEVRFWLLTVLNAGFLVGLLVVLLKNWHMPRWQFIACVGILAGGLGNLIDRVTNHGQVTDFLNLGIGNLRTGIFNVADIAITGGALLLAWLWWRDGQAAPATAPTQTVG